MRISDWSSDVCSSDLASARQRGGGGQGGRGCVAGRNRHADGQMEWRAAAAPVSHRRGASPGGTRTRSADDRGGSIDAFMSVTAAPAGEDRVAIARFLEQMAAAVGASRHTLPAFCAALGVGRTVVWEKWVS